MKITLLEDQNYELKSSQEQLQDDFSEIQQDVCLLQRNEESNQQKLRNQDVVIRELEQQIVENRYSSTMLFTQLQEKQEEISQWRAKIEDCEKLINSLQNQITVANENEQNIKKELILSNESLLVKEKLIEELRQLSRATKEEQIIQMNANVKLEKEFNDLQTSNNQLLTQIQSLSMDIQTFQEEAQQITNENILQQDQMELKTSLFEAKNQELKQKEIEWLESLNDLQEEISILMRDKENAKQKLHNQENIILEQEHKIFERQSQLNELFKQVEERQLENNQQQKLIISLQQINQDTQHQLDKAQTDNNRLQQQCEELLNSQTHLFESIQFEKQAQNQQFAESHEVQERLLEEIENNQELKRKIDWLQDELSQLQHTIQKQEQSIVILKDQNERLQIQQNLSSQKSQRNKMIESEIQGENIMDAINQSKAHSLSNPLESNNRIQMEEPVNSSMFNLQDDQNPVDICDQSQNILQAFSQNMSQVYDAKNSGENQNLFLQNNQEMILEESPSKDKAIIEELKKQIEVLRCQHNQKILSSPLLVLIGENTKEFSSDKEQITDLIGQCEGLQIEIQKEEFEKKELFEKSESIRKKNDSLELQINYLNKTIKILQETNSKLHQKIDQIEQCKDNQILLVLRQAFNQELQWEKQSEQISGEGEDALFIKVICQELFNISLSKAQGEKLKKQLDKEQQKAKQLESQIKLILTEKQVLSQQLIEVRSVNETSTRRQKFSEPNSALKIDQSLDADEGPSNIRQLIVRQKKEAEILRAENHKLQGQIKEQEQNEDIYMKQNKLMKDENKQQCNKINILEEQIKKLTEKISNSTQGALAEHLQTNVQKFFEAIQLEKKQELQAYCQNLIKMSGFQTNQQGNQELIQKITDIVEKKKTKGVLGMFR